MKQHTTFNGIDPTQAASNLEGDASQEIDFSLPEIFRSGLRLPQLETKFQFMKEQLSEVMNQLRSISLRLVTLPIEAQSPPHLLPSVDHHVASKGGIRSATAAVLEPQGDRSPQFGPEPSLRNKYIQQDVRSEFRSNKDRSHESILEGIPCINPDPITSNMQPHGSNETDQYQTNSRTSGQGNCNLIDQHTNLVEDRHCDVQIQRMETQFALMKQPNTEILNQLKLISLRLSILSEVPVEAPPSPINVPSADLQVIGEEMRRQPQINSRDQECSSDLQNLGEHHRGRELQSSIKSEVSIHKEINLMNEKQHRFSSKKSMRTEEVEEIMMDLYFLEDEGDFNCYLYTFVKLVFPIERLFDSCNEEFILNELLQLFVGGLREEFRFYVSKSKPTTLFEAMNLVVLYEDLLQQGKAEERDQTAVAEVVGEQLKPWFCNNIMTNLDSETFQQTCDGLGNDRARKQPTAGKKNTCTHLIEQVVGTAYIIIEAAKWQSCNFICKLDQQCIFSYWYLAVKKCTVIVATRLLPKSRPQPEPPPEPHPELQYSHPHFIKQRVVDNANGAPTSQGRGGKLEAVDCPSFARSRDEIDFKRGDLIRTSAPQPISCPRIANETPVRKRLRKNK